MSNWSTDVGRKLTYGTPDAAQISRTLNVSTNQGEAIVKAATDTKKQG